MELRTLGTLELNGRDGGDAAVLLAQPKRLAILVYLALARPRGFHRRDRVLAMFWPELDEPRARHALSQALHFLRRVLGPDVVTTRGRDEIALNESVLTCDAATFEDALDRGDLETAVDIYDGDLLAGFFLSDAPAFEQWLEEERTRLRQRAVDAARRLADQLGDEGHQSAEVRVSVRASHLDPLDEKSQRRLMRALDRAGNRAAALRVYDAFARRLRQELDAEPSPETQALHAAIRDRAVASHDSADVRLPRSAPGQARPVSSSRAAFVSPPSAPSTAAAAPSPLATRRWSLSPRVVGAVALGLLLTAAAGSFALRRPAQGGLTDASGRVSIAVLPFVDMSATGESGYLADGLTEEITSALANARGLAVAARTSAYAFKGRNLDVRDIGRRLGVATVLEGSIRVERERLRVTAQLINARDGMHVWSESYDRPLSDLIGVQSDIARAIASALKLRFVEPAVATVVDPEAYDAYLRGRFLLRERVDRARAESATRYFQQAIERDSSFARAYAGLADAYVQLAEFVVPRSILAGARSVAARAVALDAGSVDARLALADLLLVHDHDWAGAEREYRAALELDPRSVQAHQRYARFLGASRRFDESIAMTRKALELGRSAAADPVAFAVHEHNALAAAFFSARRYHDAVREGQEALRRDPNSWAARATLGRTFVEMNRHPEAIAALEQAWNASQRTPALARLGYAYARAGRQTDAHRVLADLAARADTGYLPRDQIALIQLGLGDRAGAIASLERAFEERHWWLPWINQAPPFDTLRSDARFRALLARLGAP